MELEGFLRNSGIAGTDSMSMQFRNSVPESQVYFRGYSTTIYIVHSEGEGRRQFCHGIPELDRSGISRNWWELVGISRNWWELVGIGRNWWEFVGIGGNWWESVGIGGNS